MRDGDVEELVAVVEYGRDLEQGCWEEDFRRGTFGGYLRKWW